MPSSGTRWEKSPAIARLDDAADGRIELVHHLGQRCIAGSSGFAIHHGLFFRRNTVALGLLRSSQFAVGVGRASARAFSADLP